VGNLVHSMTTTSLNGSYFMVTPFSMVFGAPCYGLSF
jgi:hypothetical protein